MSEIICRAGRIFTVVIFILCATLCSGAAAEKKQIGILMFSEETRYVEAAQGFMNKLREEGFAEPDVKFVIGRADANKAKAAQLVREFAAAKMDLIYTLGTSMTIPVAREIKDVPIVFSVIYDPVRSGIAKDWNSSGNNTTGVSSKVSMSKLVDKVMEMSRIRRLAVLYTPGEQNSEVTVRDLQAIQGKYQIKVIPVPLETKEEVLRIMPEVIRTSDAIFITGSNLVDSQILNIVDMANRARVITVTHLADLVDKGVLLGVCANPDLMGRLAGVKAIKIIKGARPSAVPIETLKEYDLIINLKTMKTGAFHLPPELIRKAIRTVK